MLFWVWYVTTVYNEDIILSDPFLYYYPITIPNWPNIIPDIRGFYKCAILCKILESGWLILVINVIGGYITIENTQYK